jgi:hypothetical protein
MLKRNICFSCLKIYFTVPPLLQVWDVIGRSVVVAEGRDDLGLGSDLKSKVGYLSGIATTFLMTF